MVFLHLQDNLSNKCEVIRTLQVREFANGTRLMPIINNAGVRFALPTFARPAVGGGSGKDLPTLQ